MFAQHIPSQVRNGSNDTTHASFRMLSASGGWFLMLLESIRTLSSPLRERNPSYVGMPGHARRLSPPPPAPHLWKTLRIARDVLSSTTKLVNHFSKDFGAQSVTIQLGHQLLICSVIIQAGSSDRIQQGFSRPGQSLIFNRSCMEQLYCAEKTHIRLDGVWIMVGKLKQFCLFNGTNTNVAGWGGLPNGAKEPLDWQVVISAMTN